MTAPFHGESIIAAPIVAAGTFNPHQYRRLSDPFFYGSSDSTSRRTPSEKRSVSEACDVTVEQSMAGLLTSIAYHDAQTKGGGSRIEPWEFVRAYPGANHPIDAFWYFGERDKRYVRFSDSVFPGFGGPFGAFGRKDAVVDYLLNERFMHHSGLRTRKTVDIVPLPRNHKISTQHGFLTLEEFNRLHSTEAVIATNFIRSKYRLVDPLRFMYETIFFSGHMGDARYINFATVPDLDPYSPSQLTTHFLGETSLFDEETREHILTEFTFLKNELLKRMVGDSDWRIASLLDSHDTSSDLGEFYLDYLEILASVIGTELGKMHLMRALPVSFSAQNVTLLGEIVDHEETLVDGKAIDERGIGTPQFKMIKDYDLDTNEGYTQVFMGKVIIVGQALMTLMRDIRRAQFSPIDVAYAEDVIDNLILEFVVGIQNGETSRDYRTMHAAMLRKLQSLYVYEDDYVFGRGKDKFVIDRFKKVLRNT